MSWILRVTLGGQFEEVHRSSTSTYYQWVQKRHGRLYDAFTGWMNPKQ